MTGCPCGLMAESHRDTRTMSTNPEQNSQPAWKLCLAFTEQFKCLHHVELFHCLQSELAISKHLLWAEFFMHSVPQSPPAVASWQTSSPQKAAGFWYCACYWCLSLPWPMYLPWPTSVRPILFPSKLPSSAVTDTLFPQNFPIPHSLTLVS